MAVPDKDGRFILDEGTLINLAIAPDARSRYRMLLGNPKKRAKLLDMLNHKPRLDPRYTTWFKSLEDAIDAMSVPVDTQVYVVSDIGKIDGATLSLGDAIEEMILGGWGTLIGISPTLALYYGERGESAALIQKKK